MRVAAGDLPMGKACAFVRRYFQVLAKVGNSAVRKGRALREFREMNAEVFKLLPREDTLRLGSAETIVVGEGADERADEIIETQGQEVPSAEPR
jgi:hypothetical protein